MQTIAVYSSKGGAGKSAVTVLLAEVLACDPFKKRMLVIDLDPQQASATALLGDESLHAALRDNKSVTSLLQQHRKGSLSAEETRQFLAVRPTAKGKGQFNYLQEIHILASDREAWHDLDEDLRAEMRSKSNGRSLDSLLRDALSPLSEDFDIALIDFPGHDTGPIVRCGLYASDRWLFPVMPDRTGARDLDSTRSAIRAVYQDKPREFKRLGTLLTLCQQRGGGEYRKARNALQDQAKHRKIPPLFSADAELLFWTDVKNALDDNCRYTTLEQKLGGGTTPLYTAMKKLARETMEKLRMTPPAEDLETTEPVNALVTESW